MSKAVLKKELKGAELSAKEKELQVVYEELESALGVKTGKGKELYYDEDRDRNDPLFDWSNLESPEMIDREKRFKAAYQYLHENFSDDFLKKSSVQPGPLFKETDKRLEATTNAIKNARIESAFSSEQKVPFLSPEDKWYQEVRDWRIRAENDFKERAKRRKATAENDAKRFFDRSVAYGIGWALEMQDETNEIRGNDFFKKKEEYMREKKDLEFYREAEKSAKAATSMGHLDTPLYYTNPNAEKEAGFRDLVEKNNEKIELSPYKQRLQNLIRERMGR